MMAKHSKLGVFGIFEAKGGKSKLGNASYGKQMSEEWISHWIDKLTRSNSSSQFAADLRDAYDDKENMLAVITRLNLNNTVEFKVTAQSYKRGKNIKWGSEW